MNDLEWPMLSYYVIYYENFRKVMQWTEKVALITKGSYFAKYISTHAKAHKSLWKNAWDKVAIMRLTNLKA